MRLRLALGTCAASAVIVALLLTTGCSDAPAGALETAGRVRPSVVRLGAPPLPPPSIAGPDAPSERASALGPASAPNALATPVSGRVAVVRVRVGDRVRPGEVLAEMDPTLLDLSIRTARADARETRARADVLRDRLEEIDDRRAELRDKRTQPLDALEAIAEARRTLAAQRAQLPETEADLRTQRAELIGRQRELTTLRDQLRGQEAALLDAIARLERLLADPSLPPTPPPGTEDPRETLARLRANLAQVRAALAQLEAGVRQLAEGIAAIDAGLARIAVARPRLAQAERMLDSNESRARHGLERIDEGLEALAEARDRVADGIVALDALGKAVNASVGTASAYRQLAVVRAPTDAVVVDAVVPGTVALVGAPLVTLRTTAPALVDTYLTPEQLRGIGIGHLARIRGDWTSTAVRAKVVHVDARLGFPPTTFPTSLTHMTRAVRVTLRADPSTSLPPGVPVDVLFDERD